MFFVWLLAFSDEGAIRSVGANPSLSSWESDAMPYKNVVLAVLWAVAAGGKGGSGAPVAMASPGADSSGPGATPASQPDGRRRAAAEWLAALRSRNVAVLVRMTRLPFLVDGFDVETGRESCVRFSKTQPIASRIRATAHTEADLAAVLGCVIRDALLLGSVPKYSPDSWPRSLRPSKDTAGALSVVAGAKVSSRMARYSDEIKRLARNHDLVEAMMTDNNGSTVCALIALIRIEGTWKTAAVLIDERFEE
jgi:hypothetical protein